MATKSELPLLTLDEVAARLRISKRRAIQLTTERDLACVRIGNRRLVSELALRKFVENGGVRPRVSARMPSPAKQFVLSEGPAQMQPKPT